jgi:N-acetylmuramoyl-L-alanine amidase
VNREINKIIIHCSDSDVNSHDNIETIRKWHTERGFTGPDGVSDTLDDIGYHYVITKSGKTFVGRDENEIGAGVKGYNKNSIHVCLTGKNEFSIQQFNYLEILLIDLCGRYGLEAKDIYGHCELDKGKTCPNFNVKDWLLTLKWS